MTYGLHFKSSARAFIFDQDVGTISAIKPYFIFRGSGSCYTCRTRNCIDLVNRIKSRLELITNEPVVLLLIRTL